MIGGRSRRSGRSSGGRARSAKTRTRDARDARGDTRDRTRRRERGRAEMVFGEGRGRSRARGRGTGPRARPVRHPPRLLKKVPLRANVSGAFGKMTFEASDRDGETFTVRPSTGRFGWIFARHTSHASTDARFAIDARRLPSATRDLRRSRGETFATNLRCLFPAESASQSRGLRPRLRTPRESVRESTPAMDDASPISATRAPALSHAPLRASGRGALCRRHAREHR